ncbi:Fur-regulated basic protein B [Virgibacillus subterraneus]|uniref:Fur-regulated basic protein B n=2 Tax=Virgibacillus TaxID=84406 RepID=A0A1H1CNW2_9BACI|nr:MULTISPECIES: FbpB family small basic protein [Virgibacillus]SDQ65266.1 Fur-regulated basic protein B [Virgibacillus salinus]SEQ63609.1 Fur-regulated basic protein B [Virgibacillus subterraneus]
MRPIKYQNFEDLVQQNKQELLRDENELEQIELRLEKKQSDKKSNPEHFSSYYQ